MNAIASPPTSPTTTVYLVALDDSPSAVMVLDMACGLGSTLGGAAELHIVHVAGAASTGLDGNPTLPQQLQANGKLVLDRSTEHAASRFKGKIVGHLAVGVAWREITQLASYLSADVVLVGTSGRTGIARVLLGSVAEQVVRHAGCPVVVLRPKDHHTQAEIGIEPPCGDCVAVQVSSSRSKLWCERHSTHHPAGHLHYETPPSFALGSMNFRP
jgi:nucleotide-binding universal stress UspA family protein